MLVLHQRDEGTHDYRKAGQKKGRQLIDERFAATRRHHNQRILPGENCFERLPLTGTEILMTKPVLEQLAGCFLRYLLRHSADIGTNYSAIVEFPFPTDSATVESPFPRLTEKSAAQ